MAKVNVNYTNNIGIKEIGDQPDREFLQMMKDSLTEQTTYHSEQHRKWSGKRGMVSSVGMAGGFLGIVALPAAAAATAATPLIITMAPAIAVACGIALAARAWVGVDRWKKNQRAELATRTAQKRVDDAIHTYDTGTYAYNRNNPAFEINYGDIVHSVIRGHEHLDKKQKMINDWKWLGPLAPSRDPGEVKDPVTGKKTKAMSWEDKLDMMREQIEDYSVYKFGSNLPAEEKTFREPKRTWYERAFFLGK